MVLGVAQCPYTPPVYSYEWTPSSGLSTPTSENTNATFTTDTEYTITATHPNGICKISDTVNVYVDPIACAPACDDPLVVTLSETGSEDICTPISKAITVGQTGTGTFDYSIDGGTTWQASNSFTLTSGATYNVQVRDNANPADNACKKTSGDYTIVAIDKPAIPTFTTSTTDLCAGATGESYVIGAEVGADDYTWTYSGTNTSFNPAAPTGTSATLDFANNATSGDVEVTANNTCGSSDKATVAVTVNSLPSVTANSDATANTICNGEAVILTGGGASTYVWDNSVTDGTAINPTATTTYTVEGTDANGCKDSETVAITVNSLPSVTANSDATANTICSGEAVILTGGGASTYVWDNSVTDGTAINPTATTTYTVEGTDANGCKDSETVAITVNSLPSVTAISDATANTICSGEAVILTGGGASTYVWDNSVTDGTAINPTATTTYTVEGTDANGCKDSETVAITVNSLPSVTATSDATANTICNGEAVILTGGGASTYVWDNSVTDGTVINPTATTTYTVEGTDANGCKDSETIAITVNSLPSVTANSDATANTICNGEAVILTGGGASTYVWDNSVTDGTAINPTATTTYTVEGTDANGCKDSETIAITVNSLPSVTANSDATANTICNGEAVILTGGGASTYVWDNSVTDGTAINPTATTTYTVEGTDANGCKDSETVAITVNSLPSVTANSDATANTICNGEAVILTGGGASTYVWDNSVTDGTAINPTATTTYTVEGTDANGCKDSETVAITVNSLPSVTANSDATANTICNGEAVILTGGGASTYVWDNSVTDGTAINPTATTTYTVEGTDANGCKDSETVAITVNSLPSVTANSDATANTICSGEAVILTGGGASTYVWDNSVTDGTVINPTATTTYTVEGTDANGCKDSETIAITVNSLPSVTANSDATANTICNGEAVILTGGGASTYVWDNSVTDGTAINPTATTTYTVEGTDANGCKDSETVAITVNAQPTFTVTPPATNQCGSYDLSSAVSAVSAGTAKYYSDATATTELGSSTVSTVGTTTYYAQVDDGTCQSIIKAIAVTVTAGPTVTVTNQTAQCGGTYDLASSFNPSAGTITYYSNSGATMAIAKDVNSSATYYAQTDDAGCKSGVESVVVTINEIPTFTVTNPVAQCAGSYDMSTAVSAMSPVGATLAYYDALTGGNVVGNSISTTGTNSYYLEATKDGCTSASRQEVEVIIDETVTLTAATPAAVCSPNTVNITSTVTPVATTLTYHVGAGGTGAVVGDATAVLTTGTYSVKGVNGTCNATEDISVTVNPQPTFTFTAPATNQCGSYDLSTAVSAISAGTVKYYSDAAATTELASPTVSTVGTTTYYAQVDDGTCQSIIKAIAVTVTAGPTVTVTNQIAQCGGTYDLSNSFSPSAGTITYYSNSGATMAIAKDVNSSATYYAQTDDAGCQSGVESVVVTINEIPTFTVTPPATNQCGSYDLSTAVSAVSAGTAKYYSDATATTELGSSTVSTVGTTTYYAQVDDGTCQSIIKAIAVTVTAGPTVTVTNQIAQCGGTYDLSNSFNPSAGTITYYSNSGATMAIAKDVNSSATYYAQTDDAGCKSAIENVVVTINEIPTFTVTNPVAQCSGSYDMSTAVSAMSPVGATLAYYDALTGGNVVGNSISTTGTNSYYLEATKDGCTSASRQEVEVIIDETVTLTAATPAAVCSPNPVSIISSALPVATTLTYHVGAGGTGVAVGDATAVTTGGTYSVKGVNGTCNATDDILVTINEIPEATLTNSSVEICDDGSENATLNLSVTGGNPNYDIVLSNGQTVNLTTATGTHNVSTAAIYTVTSVKDLNTNCINTTTNTGTVTVTDRTNMTITAPVTSCDGSNDVIVTFDVAGGDVSNYAVTGITGTFVGNTFTSNAMAENITYTFGVEDATSCNYITGQTFTRSCTCLETVDLTLATGTSPVSICGDGTTEDLEITLAGGVNYSFDLYRDGTTLVQAYTNETTGTITKAVSDEGIYTIKNYVGSCIASLSGSIEVKHKVATAITTQPTIAGVLCDGDALALSTVADGENLTYQWKLGTVNIGTDAPTYNVASTVKATHEGDYSVVVTGDCGVKTSIPLTVTINETTADAGVMTGATAICDNATETYSVPVVAGVNVKYTWEVTPSAGVTFSTPSDNNSIDITFATANSYVVKVTPVGDCGTGLSTQITVTNPGIVTPTVTLAQTPILPCEGDAVTIKATVSGGGVTPVFVWTTGVANNGSTTDELILTSVADADAVSVAMTSSLVCVSVATASDNITVTAKKKPVTPTFVTTDVAVCAGENAVGYSISTVTGADNYTWSYSGANAMFTPVPTGTTGTVNFGTTATSGDVEVTANNVCGSSAKATIAVTVTPIPTIAVTAHTAQCGGTYNLASSFNPSAGTITYYTNSGATTVATNPVNSSATYYAKTAVGSCNSVVESVAVTINEIPTFTVTAPVAIQCKDYELSSAVSGISTGAIVKYYSDATATTELTSSLITATGPYYAKAIDGTCESVPQSIAVTVTPIPTIAVTAHTAQCGGTYNLASSFNPSAGVVAYYDNVPSSPAMASSVVSSTDTYYAVTTVGICSSATASVVVTINEIPAKPSANYNSVCTDDELHLLINSPSVLLTYDWKDAGGSFIGQGSDLLVTNNVAPINEQTYTVVASVNGCSSLSDNVTVVIQPTPHPAVTMNGVDVTDENKVICMYDLPITIQVANATTELVSWTRNSIEPKGNGVTLSLTEEGIYEVTLNNGTCSSKAKVTVSAQDLAVSILSTPETLSLGETADLEAVSIGDIGILTYAWSDSNSETYADDIELSITPEKSTTFYVTIKDETTNCEATSEFQLVVFLPITIPNAFTPNGDGINDTWVIGGLEEYPDTKVFIYNRWGQKIHQSKGGFTSWDGMNRLGKKVTIGTYYYIIHVGGNGRKLQGDVTVIR